MSQLTNFGSGGGGGGVDSVSGGVNITITGPASDPIVNLSGPIDHTVQVGNALGGLTSLPLGTTGQVLTGVTGLDPQWMAPAGIVATVSGGENISITGTATDPIVNVALTTEHAIQVGSAAGSLFSLPLGATGEILAGSTGADPVWITAPAPGTVTLEGDAGTPITGATLDIVGTTSGAVFTGDGANTLTLSFDFISMPASTSTNGQIIIDGIPALYQYPDFNSIFLGGSGNFTNIGQNNIGIGTFNLPALDSGTENTIIGSNTATIYDDGSQSTIIGAFSVGSMVGASSGNTMIGYSMAGSLVNGSNNCFMGQNVASAYTSNETGNILIGSDVEGIAGESFTIRIGRTGAGGTITSCYIAGIRGVTTVNNDAIPVLVDSDGQLGTVSSSIKFKDNVEPMGSYSDKLLDLEPVTFELKTHPGIKHSGLIAEEVEKYMPMLVAYDRDKKPFSVKYHDMPAMLLNELKKLSKRVSDLERQLCDKSCK